MLKFFALFAFSVATINASTLSAPYSPQSGGMTPPHLPEEFAFNYIQHKWNENGFGVSHASSGTWLSSLKHKKVRTDISSYDWASNNATVKGKIRGSVVSSIFDFSQSRTTGNVTNIYIQSNGLDRTCSKTELPQTQSQGQLFPSDFLKQMNAIYTGRETVNGIGYTYYANKWIVIIGNTYVSFYFNEEGDWIRFDQNSQGLQTTVVTWIYNLNSSAEFDDNVFNINNCTI